MLARFSLYGFLKNQRYFEPFIILFFLSRGLSFTQIGLLVGFRELAINLMEIPSGAVADLFGRRRSMMLSFTAYIAAFAVFGSVRHFGLFFLAMFFFAVGEAFRTGTHKAMIFSWLRLQGRSDEKTKIYGYTRSWAKIGSAVSVILATIFVIWTNNYSYIFYFAIIPYLGGLVNFMFYPRELEGQPAEAVDIGTVLRHLWVCLKDAVCVSNLRRLIAESMGFEGVYKAVENYLQPVIKALALSLPLLVAMSDTRRSAVLVGAVYFVIYLASAWASRQSHRLVSWAGGDQEGSRRLWLGVFVIYAAMIPLLYFHYYWPAIIGFVVLSLIQNFWGPLIVTRFDAYATETQGATVLSIRSQATSIATMVVAPALGALVDYVKGHAIGGEFWPVAAVAAAIALAVVLLPIWRNGVRVISPP
jgi:MFS family permease